VLRVAQSDRPVRIWYHACDIAIWTWVENRRIDGLNPMPRFLTMRHRKAFISAGESVLAGSVVDARFNVGNKFSLAPSKRACRRITSMALKRAVEISRGAACPECSLWQDFRAAANPSCIASSARSRSPRSRTSVANPARFRSVKSFNGPAELFGHRRRASTPN